MQKDKAKLIADLEKSKVRLGQCTTAEGFEIEKLIIVQELMNSMGGQFIAGDDAISHTILVQDMPLKIYREASTAYETKLTLNEEYQKRVNFFTKSQENMDAKFVEFQEEAIYDHYKQINAQARALTDKQTTFFLDKAEKNNEDLEETENQVVKLLRELTLKMIKRKTEQIKI